MTPYNCAVTVNITGLEGDIRRMTMSLHCMSVAAHEANPRFDPIEEENIAVLLHEALNHYVGFVLRAHVQRGTNIGFDYYLDEYFPSFAWYVKEQPNAVNSLGSLFVTIAGGLAHSLKPGLDQVEFHGQDITDITTIVLCPGKTQMYILEGNVDCLDDGTLI